MASKTTDSATLGTGGPTVTVSAVETDLLGPDGMNVELMDRFEFGVKNTGGAQAATVKVYYQYVAGGVWFQDLGSGNAPSVAFGASVRLAFPNITCRRVRVTGTAAAATTTLVLEGRGMGYQ